jgi:anaerobic ribonucleoside-triphosphate reductase
VNANANQGYSLGGLILNVSGKVIANYWLNHIYAPEIGEAHRAGDLHIHDLDMLAGYCAGWSLRTLLAEGFNGIPGKVEAKPPKHLSSAVGQMVNFLGTLQNEWAGAVSFSVHPKETIVLKDKFDNIQVRRIGEFCDSFIEKYDGQQINGISIVNIKEEGFRALSFNKDGVVEWKPVTKTIRHHVTDPLHILKTNKGMLCVSKNHSVFSLDKHIYVGPKSKEILGLFVVKEKISSTELKSKAAELNIRSPIKLIEGLHSKKLIDSRMIRDENGKVWFAIYCAKFQNGLVLKKTKELMPEKEVKTKKTDVSNVAALFQVELEARDEIDLYQVIRENEYLKNNTIIYLDNPEHFKDQVFQNGSLRTVLLRLNKTRSYLRGTLSLGWVPFDIYDEYQGDYEGEIQIGKKRGGDKYPRFLIGKQLENIIKLIAWYLSEGHTTSTGIGITQFNEGFVEEIKFLLDELNAVYSINLSKKLPRKRSFVVGGYLGFFIKTLGGKYADNKQIPSFVFNVSRKNKEKFFRELIKGDGYKRDKGFAYVSTSNLLITGLNLILLDLGYRTSIKTRFEENFEEKVVGPCNSANDGEYLTRYDLIIHENHDAVWPHNDFESAIIHENVAFNSKAPYEYDLSVEDNESFVGGVGLFALHNSTVDTYLAPLVRNDKLSYKKVKQGIQELIYNLNVPSRWGCVPLDTEILTKDGWKLKDEISTADKIYGFQNGNIIDDEILALNEYDFDGELIAFSNRSQEQLLTPNHRVLRLGYNDNKEKFFVDEASALFEAKSPVNVPVAGLMLQEDYAISDDLIRQNALQEELQINILRKCSERQIKLFIETCIQEDGKSFATKDNNIKDGLQELAVLVGYETEVVEYRSSDNDLYYIMVFTKGSAKVTLTNQKKVNYKGKVWCPTTGSSYWIARRKGSVFITGNSQTPFTNLTFDWVCPEDLRDQIPYIGGEEMPFSYGDLQVEMDMINRAFIEVMTEGDAKGRIFTFPIPTYNITPDFPWDSPNTDLLFNMTARYGLPYFQGFINSDLKPNMVRSMCCRLQLDLNELLKRGNGLFGSSEQTGCYDDETEVFTNNGWKFFKDVIDTDLALSMDMGNCVPEFVNIDSSYEYDFNGDLIHFESLRVDLLVTPNHRMIYKDRDHSVQVKTAQQIQQYRTFDIPNNRPINRTKTEAFFVLPELRIRNRFYPEVRISYELWAEFMGFYLSEGYCDKKETSEKTKQYRIIISQTKESFKKDIERILDQLPFAYSKFDNGYQLDNKPLCLYLRQFGCHDEKFIPPDLKEQSCEVLANLWNALIKGDGHKRKDRSHVETYWTTSLRLVEDIREILIYMGFNSSCQIQKKKDSFIRGRLISKENQKDCFVITKITKSCNSVMADRTTTVPYQGKVYCLEVKHGSLLVRRKGHINWCGNSLGVVTINCARLGYLYKGDETGLYQRLDTLLELGRDSLEVKREVIQQYMDNGLFPFTKRYLGTLRNHFSTLGVNGINEMIRNFSNDQYDIASEWGKAFAVRLLEHIRARMVEFQEKTGHMYNLEATPAEGTTYRFAKEDKKRYPDIIQAGTSDRPYYTNSSQLPVGFTDDPFEALALQDELQTKYTGGTVLHLYMNERISNAQACKNLVRRVLENYSLPYITVTPTFSICPVHGYLDGEYEFCPLCDEDKLSHKVKNDEK